MFRKNPSFCVANLLSFLIFFLCVKKNLPYQQNAKLHHHTHRELHRRAMQRTMLADEHAAVDGYDVMFGECFLQLPTGELIVLGLAVGGHQNCSVYNQEIGIGGRQTVPILGVVDGSWKREGDEAPLLTSLGREETMQLLLHRLEGLIVLVGGVGTLHIGDDAVGAETGKGIDVAVCVVAGQIAVIEPQDTLGVEITPQALFYLEAIELGVAVGRKQTRAGGQQRAAPVALDAATLEDEVQVGFVVTE